MTISGPLNEVFKRHAASYMRGDTVFFIDGSGGIPEIFKEPGGENVITGTLHAAAAYQRCEGLNARGFYWTDERQPHPLDLAAGPMQWMRQFPNAQSLLLPALRWLEAQYAEAEPLHIIIVSDGLIADDVAQATKDFRRLLARDKTFVDAVIAHSPGAVGTTPLEEALNMQVFDMPEKALPVARTTTMGGLRATLHDIIEARMAPEALRGALSETLHQGTAKPLSPMATIRWKK